MNELRPRAGVYDTYWYFAAERQRIFHRKRRGETPPYTADPILATYKFCNVYRASDRVSQFLIRDVIYNRRRDPSGALFRIFFFRLLNRPETWRRLEEPLGQIELASFDFDRYAAALDELKTAGPIYGNAFVLCANKAFGYAEKHRNHLALLHQVFIQDRYDRVLLRSQSLKELFEALRALPLIGDFMAYQLAIDFNYSEVFDYSENDFTVAGPGAQRGLAKCFENAGQFEPAEIIQRMVQSQAAEFKRLGLQFEDLGGRPLQAIDCQGLFCEVDKYCRVAFPELASNRHRIKATYRPDATKLEYFFPPKWGVTL